MTTDEGLIEMKIIKESKVKEAITGFLINFPFFNILDENELSIIADHIDFIEIDPGEILCREGDEGDCVYFVVDGELDVIKESIGARRIGVDRVVIAKLSKGRSIGEMSIMDKIPRSATVQACSSAILVSLTLNGFNQILEEHPAIGIKILKGIAHLLSLNLRKTSARLADYMLHIS